MGYSVPEKEKILSRFVDYIKTASMTPNATLFDDSEPCFSPSEASNPFAGKKESLNQWAKKCRRNIIGITIGRFMSALICVGAIFAISITTIPSIPAIIGISIGFLALAFLIDRLIMNWIGKEDYSDQFDSLEENCNYNDVNAQFIDNFLFVNNNDLGKSAPQYHQNKLKSIVDWGRCNSTTAQQIANDLILCTAMDAGTGDFLCTTTTDSGPIVTRKYPSSLVNKILKGESISAEDVYRSAQQHMVSIGGVSLDAGLGADSKGPMVPPLPISDLKEAKGIPVKTGDDSGLTVVEARPVIDAKSQGTPNL